MQIYPQQRSGAAVSQPIVLRAVFVTMASKRTWAPSPLFHRSGGHALDDVFLQHDRDDDQGQDRRR